jgi:hypothetical protein
VKVILLQTERREIQSQSDERMPLAEFSAWLKEQPATGRSREEIDAQIAEERDAWS